MIFYKGFKHTEATIAKFRLRVGEKAGRWKGGTYINQKGYCYVYSPDHPFATKDGYVFEHRLVMEKHIGRYLIPNVDDVHHKNGVRDDNRIKNLQLIKHGDHTILTNTKDFSNVRCCYCGNSTLIKKNGKPMWYHDKNDREKFVCKRCYDGLHKGYFKPLRYAVV